MQTYIHAYIWHDNCQIFLTFTFITLVTLADSQPTSQICKISFLFTHTYILACIQATVSHFDLQELKRLQVCSISALNEFIFSDFMLSYFCLFVSKNSLCKSQVVSVCFSLKYIISCILVLLSRSLCAFLCIFVYFCARANENFLFICHYF